MYVTILWALLSVLLVLGAFFALTVLLWMFRDE